MARLSENEFKMLQYIEINRSSPEDVYNSKFERTIITGLIRKGLVIRTIRANGRPYIKISPAGRSAIMKEFFNGRDLGTNGVISDWVNKNKRF